MNYKLDNIISQRESKIIYRDGDSVIKVFDENYSKEYVLNEALNQARVEETGLNIPKIIEVTKLENKWAIVTEFIEGKTLAELMAENPSEIDNYLILFVDLQLSIHSKRAELLTKHRDKMKRKVTQSGLDATARYELHTRIEGMKRHNKVLHGDFNPSNIIIKPDGTPFIIDWAHATQGNGSADIARSYLLFCLDGQNEIAEKYLELFCQKSDTAKQLVQRWLPIVAATQLVKGKPEQREFLLKWVDVVDYE